MISFREHITKIADKASIAMSSLSLLMRNVGGLRATKRRLLMSVTNFMLPYIAESWGDTTLTETHNSSALGSTEALSRVPYCVSNIFHSRYHSRKSDSTGKKDNH